MTNKTKIALGAALGLSMITQAQQIPQPQPAAAQVKPCAPPATTPPAMNREIKKEKARFTARFGNVLAKATHGAIDAGDVANAEQGAKPSEKPKPCAAPTALTPVPPAPAAPAAQK